MSPTGRDKMFCNLLKKRLPSSTVKGKGITTGVIPERVEPLSTVFSSPQMPPSGPAHASRMALEERRCKRKKEKEHKSSHWTFNCSSSPRSSKRLFPSTTFGDLSTVMDFLSHRVMILNRVMIELDKFKKGPFTSSFAAELNNAFLKLCSRTLLADWIMGVELLKKEADEKLKKDLVKVSSSL